MIFSYIIVFLLLLVHADTTMRHLNIICWECSCFQVDRAHLLTSAADCLHYHWTTANDNTKLKFLLYGCNEVDFDSNRTLFLAVQEFIINSRRFSTTT
jgi:hypothetical protein